MALFPIQGTESIVSMAAFTKCLSCGTIPLQAGEKDKEDNTIDALGPNEMVGMKNVELHDLKRRLAERETRQELDGYGYYL